MDEFEAMGIDRVKTDLSVAYIVKRNGQIIIQPLLSRVCQFTDRGGASNGSRTRLYCMASSHNNRYTIPAFGEYIDLRRPGRKSLFSYSSFGTNLYILVRGKGLEPIASCL